MPIIYILEIKHNRKILMSEHESCLNHIRIQRIMYNQR